MNHPIPVIEHLQGAGARTSGRSHEGRSTEDGGEGDGSGEHRGQGVAEEALRFEAIGLVGRAGQQRILRVQDTGRDLGTRLTTLEPGGLLWRYTVAAPRW